MQWQGGLGVGGQAAMGEGTGRSKDGDRDGDVV